MSWVAALQEYNSKTGTKFVVPKKDTPEYHEVKKIQEAGKASAPVTTIKKVTPAPAVAPKGRGRPKKTKAPDAPATDTPSTPAPVKATPVKTTAPPPASDKRRVIKRVITEEYLEE